MRVWATQAWPLFMSEANLRPSIVAARSASSRMMAADLPPSSRLHRLSCSPQIEAMRAAGGGGAGEGDLVDARVAHEVLADLAAGGDHADDALRDAGLLEQLGHEHGVERRLGRRLDDDRAAGRAAPGASFDIVTNCGHVPRHDGADDADGLAAHDDVGVPSMPGALLLPRRSFGATWMKRVEHHPRRRATGPAARSVIGEPISVVMTCGHVHHAGGVDVGEPLHGGDALRGRQAGPLALVERRAGGGDGAVDVGRRCPRAPGRRPPRCGAR